VQSPTLAGVNDDFDKGKIGMGVEFLLSIDNTIISEAVFHPMVNRLKFNALRTPASGGDYNVLQIPRLIFFTGQN